MRVRRGLPAWRAPLGATLGMLLALSAPAASAQAVTPAAPAQPAASASDYSGVPVVPLQAQPLEQPQAPAAGEREHLQVTDAYVELRTGAGRGFPVFHSVGRGEWITVELRHTDWFRVRTASGRVGWVQRGQLESTLTAGGVRKTFRDVLLEDFLRRRVEFGAGWGRFKKEPMLKLWTSVRLADPITLEATAGQVQGTFSGTEFWHVGLAAEPWSDQRWSPFFGVGLGKFKNIPNSSLVSALTTDAKLANAVLGLRWHLGERFVVRADYSIYTAFIADARTDEYRAVTLGVSFFF